MQTISDFAKRLVSERKRLGLTQAEFADACGVKAASQFLYEKGDRTPNVEYLLKASRIGVLVCFLLEGEQDNKAQMPLEPKQLAKIYKDTDDKCRDPMGRLLDLEHRVNTFINLLEQNTDHFMADKRKI